MTKARIDGAPLWWMVAFFAALLLSIPAGIASGADPADDPTRFEPGQPLRVSVGVLYEEYTIDGQDVGMLTTPASVTVPLARRLAANVHVSSMLITGVQDDYFGGFSDAQVSLSYYQPVGPGSIVASISANLPTGLRELRTDRFETSVLISETFFQFQVPITGQGMNLAPSLMWAFPLGSSTVVGLGASYQRKGGFRPLAIVPETFTPGDEWSAVAGVDVQLTDNFGVVGDVIYTRYASDTLGDVSIFEAGQQIVATGQLIGEWGLNQAALMVRHRSRGRAQFPTSEGQQVAAPHTIANHSIVRGSYHTRLGGVVRLNLIAQGRFYDATDVSERRTMVDIGAAPEFVLSREIRLTSRFLYTTGDISGVEAGGGLVVVLR